MVFLDIGGPSCIAWDTYIKIAQNINDVWYHLSLVEVHGHDLHPHYCDDDQIVLLWENKWKQTSLEFWDTYTYSCFYQADTYYVNYTWRTMCKR